MFIQPRSPDIIDVPGSGVTGQTLTKSGNADGDVTWQSTAGGTPAHAPMLSGLWYNNAYRDYNSATFALAVNVSAYVPFWLDAPIRVAGVGIYVQAQSATAVCNWAFFNTSTTTGLPTTAIVRTTSAADGALPVTAVGMTSVSTSFDLPSGWVWAAIAAATATFSFTGISCTATGATGYLSSTRVPFGMTAFDPVGFPAYYQRSGVTLSDNPTSLTGVSDVSVLPRISFKIA